MTTPPTRIGKTTVAASVGLIFAQLRQDGRVVAIDADIAFGKLAARIDPHAVGSYWDLAADDHLDTFSDVRTKVGANADGCSPCARVVPQCETDEGRRAHWQGHRQIPPA
jgi:hypothetical protein